MYYPLKEVEKLNQAVVCCVGCNTAVFILPKDVNGKMLLKDVFARSEWIAPKSKPKNNEKVQCVQCGLPWGVAYAHSNFKLKEGAPSNG